MKRIAIITIVMLFLSARGTHGYAQSEIGTMSPVSLSVARNFDGTRSLSMGFAATDAGNFEQVIEPEKTARKCVEYLFTGLSLPDDRFWVNLNPGEAASVSDKELAGTDFGKILLAADLRLKKDASALTNPRTPTGREYWERLYRKADELGIAGSLPTNNRVWIAPGEVKTYEDARSITIAQSQLRVFVKPGETVVSANARTAKLQEYAGQLMQELIVPQLQKKVNEQYAYWELRQVFRALILARWFKHTAQQAQFPRENLTALDADYAYTIDEVYADYMDSFKRGEYAVAETTNKLDSFLNLITRNYISGGIDLRDAIKCQPASERSDVMPVMKFSCTFVLRDTVFSLSYAKSSMRFVSSHGAGITAELFRTMPSLVKTSVGKLTERLMDTNVRFSNSL